MVNSVGLLGSEPIVIKDDAFIPSSQLFLPRHYLPYVDQIILPRGIIEDRTEKLAQEITQFYKGKEIHVLCLLKGSRRFFDSLLHFMSKLYMYDGTTTSQPFFEHFVRVKSYSGTESTNTLEITPEDLSFLSGKHVLIVEDIIDTGNTLAKFTEFLKRYQLLSLNVASLLSKRTDKWNGIKGQFVGFSIPDHFIVGSGLDYNDSFRDLEHIGILNQTGIKTFA